MNPRNNKDCRKQQKDNQVEDDGEVTLYESSLGYEPFKE